MRVSKRVRQWLMVLSATLLVAGTLSGVPVVKDLFGISAASADNAKAGNFEILRVTMSPT